MWNLFVSQSQTGLFKSLSLQPLGEVNDSTFNCSQVNSVFTECSTVPDTMHMRNKSQTSLLGHRYTTVKE